MAPVRCPRRPLRRRRRRRRRTVTTWLLDGDEALPLQALEHRERRRQWFTALAVMPTPVRNRYLDEGGQKLGRRLSVVRFHHCTCSLHRRQRDVGHFRRTIDGTSRDVNEDRGRSARTRD